MLDVTLAVRWEMPRVAAISLSLSPWAIEVGDLLFVAGQPGRPPCASPAECSVVVESTDERRVLGLFDPSIARQVGKPW